MRSLKMLALFVPVLSMVGVACASTEQVSTVDSSEVKSALPRAQNPELTDADAARFIEGNTAFAVDLFKPEPVKNQ